MPIPSGAISRVIGIDVEYRNFNIGQALFLPQRVAIFAQGSSSISYSTNKQLIVSEKQAAEYGYGSPIHLICKRLLPANGEGLLGIPVTVYPLVDDIAGVAATGDIDVASGTATVDDTGGFVKIGGIRSARITPVVGDTRDIIATKIKQAIDAILDMPVTTGTITGVPPSVLPLTAKWKGASGNDISVDLSEFNMPSFNFLYDEYLLTGAVNPVVTNALDLIGEVWETMIINALNYNDTVTNLAFSTFNETRWGQLVKKPLLVCTGCVDDFSTRTAITDSSQSKVDRTNFLVVAPGSKELPFIIAAQALVDDIVQKANDKPAYNYTGKLNGLLAGPDEDQEDYNTRNNSVLLGSSNSIKTGSQIELNDTITFYHPDGEDPPAYRYVVDVVKLTQIIFNLDIIQESFKGRPLLPDGTPTTDPDVVQPKAVRAILSTLADSLALGRSAIISDPNFTKNNLTVEIDGSNPKRLNTIFPVKLSGNVEVNSTDIYFSFQFGG